MEKSIESIWNQGFLDENALVAPKINKLYHAKSMHTIDQFKAMYHKNFWFVLLLLVVNFGGAFWFVNIFLAIFMGALFVPILVLSKKQIRRMELIDINESSYNYVKTFHTWLQEMIAEFGLLYRFFYPLYFLGLIIGLGFMDVGEVSEHIPFIERILASDQVFIVGGVPVIWTSVLVILTGLVAYFSPKIYQVDIRMVYGRLMDRLDHILSEMEELRA